MQKKVNIAIVGFGNIGSYFFKVLENPTFDIPGPARNINKINIQDKTYYIVTINNGNPIFLEKIITP